ncbi:MAG: DPP IV N-terminal domain-containing protein [Bacteroidia bacterium]|nr:DPP IV N-terminal domain-containing protein [Bacteroidia bacterium]
MNPNLIKITLFLTLTACFGSLHAQDDPSMLNLDRIYASGEFRQQYLPPSKWVQNGEFYTKLEYSRSGPSIVKYNTATNEAEVIASTDNLTPQSTKSPLRVESYTFSKDESKILIFTNSSRVWRANTKGDYWIYDTSTKLLKQVGKKFPASSLMFAKLSDDNSSVGYVQEFNLYVEDLGSGAITQLTTDGGNGTINGTFDWVYEEEFGMRDGFRWNQDGKHIAYWKLDASETGTFYMINNTDSIYSEPIPIQYPKVGQNPSSCKVGIVPIGSKKTKWVDLGGSTIQNYVPAMQWVNENTLLIQQLNRHQNHLKIYRYSLDSEELKVIYEEEDKNRWIDIQYPDATSSTWGENSLKIVDEGQAFLRVSEKYPWRSIVKVGIYEEGITKLKTGDFDMASVARVTDKYVYYHASPDNSTQRYLYRAKLNGKGKPELITPEGNAGMNSYNISPNGAYAIHTSQSALSPRVVQIVSLPDHKNIQNLVENKGFYGKLEGLKMPTVEFQQVKLDEYDADVRIIKPINFDPAQKYPVLFHVYAEPWGQVAKDDFVGMWNIFLAQQGYVIVDMDPRGTPCLKGTEWRKSIYRKIGRLNIQDLGHIAKEVLKTPYMDNERTAVWGWSGGGSSTLNLMFQFPEVFGTGMSVAPVANQLLYDNIYQERYMGLPQENKEDFVNGSPITYAKNLEGNLLVVHGTGDDNVHYQNTEQLVNELIKNNKKFQMMAYPNRSHGIYEGRNTRRHLYTLLTDYLMEHCPVNE